MKVVIAGGTGFLGRALTRALIDAGQEVVLLTRRLEPGVMRQASRTAASASSIGWAPDGSPGSWANAIDGASTVVNLAGESIAGRRWSRQQKARILDSRLLATRSLVAAIRGASHPPAVLINGSASGYYGNRGEEILVETSPPGSDFLADVCVQWEQEAGRAAGDNTRVVLIRTGIALEADGGALPMMALPFKLFAGGRIGTGRQYLSWIHRSDWVELVRWAIDSRVQGPLNGSTPAPITNTSFAKSLGHALGRPSWLPAPAFAIHLALGEMGDALLLSSQRMSPQRATELGFRFRYPELDQALRTIYR